MKTFITATAAAMSLAMLSTPAAAKAPKGESIKVEYSDLNLTTQSGQRKLERRVKRATEQVCGYNRLQTGSRVRDPQIAKCMKEAKAKAAQTVASIIEDHRRGG